MNAPFVFHGLTALIYNKSRQPRRTAGLCPNELAGNKESAICETANDTVITLLNCVRPKTKPDTYVAILAENIGIVNPCKTKVDKIIQYFNHYNHNRFHARG